MARGPGICVWSVPAGKVLAWSALSLGMSWKEWKWWSGVGMSAPHAFSGYWGPKIALSQLDLHLRLGWGKQFEESWGIQAASQEGPEWGPWTRFRVAHFLSHILVSPVAFPTLRLRGPVFRTPWPWPRPLGGVESVGRAWGKPLPFTLESLTNVKSAPNSSHVSLKMGCDSVLEAG